MQYDQTQDNFYARYYYDWGWYYAGWEDSFFYEDEWEWYDGWGWLYVGRTSESDYNLRVRGTLKSKMIEVMMNQNQN
jgi:hypothetical protein